MEDKVEIRNGVLHQDLGLISYQQAWDYQTVLNKKLIARKRAQGDSPSYEPIHYLLTCEHKPVYTLGKSGHMDNLLLNENQLDGSEFEFFKINRGGDITYHGPGQLVVYPIFDLEYFFRDIHRYVRQLEEVVIRTLLEYNIEATRQKDFTGVWIIDNTGPSRKICAIGVHLSRWVTLHGLAFNINSDLSHFDNIVPCGIASEDKTVTSLEKELGRKVNMNEVKLKIKSHFASLFNYNYV